MESFVEMVNLLKIVNVVKNIIMKKFLQCTVTMKNGNTFENPLMMKEAYLIGQLANEHKKVKVVKKECDKKEFELLFGKQFN